MKRPSNFLKPSSDGPNRIIYTDLKSNYVFDMLMVHDADAHDKKDSKKLHLKAFKKEECRPQIDFNGNIAPPKGFGLQKRPFVRHLDLICEDFMSVIIQENESRW
jgi:hypothetical protein